MTNSNSGSFAFMVSAFLKDYLPRDMGASPTTIASYRSAFMQLYRYMLEVKDIEPYRVSFEDIGMEVIEGFLNWLEEEKKCAVSTRNGRLAALHSFAKYAQHKVPEQMYVMQQILAIEPKRAPKRQIGYLSIEEVEAILDAAARCSLRHHAVLRTMYDSGARVQEIADACLGDVSLKKYETEGFGTITLTGKGNKTRIVPLMPQTIDTLKRYTKIYHPDRKAGDPLFYNTRHEHLHRDGIAYMLEKYVKEVRFENQKAIAIKVTPHTFRHSKASHLYQAGVPLKEISFFLGHSSVMTTEIYAKISPKQALSAINKVNASLMKEAFYSNEEKTDLQAWFEAEIMGKKETKSKKA